MSKAEATGGQSLEEILASIRKSLADDGPVAAGAAAAPEEPRSEVRPAPGEAAPKPKDALPSWVTGASRSASEAKSAMPREDDLDDLFDPDPKRAAPAGADAAPAASPVAAREGDPLWFLTRRPDAPASDGGGTKIAAPEPAKEPAPVAKSDPVLSRLEALRSTLPPFFGARAEAASGDAAAPDRVKPADLGFMRPGAQQDATVPPPAAEPGTPSANGAAASTPAAAEPVRSKPAAAAALPEPERSPQQPATARPAGPTPGPVEPALDAGPVAGPVAGAKFAPAASAPAVPESAAGAVVSPAVEIESKSPPAPSPLPRAAPASVGGDVMAASPGTDTAPVSAAADVVPAGEAQAPQAHALEGMVMEMLQPMLRDWCDKNLPRLVETALKEEVSRAVKGTRDASET